MPFEQALLHLDDGRRLRLMDKQAEAVAQLEAAHRLFSDLGADPYVRRCAEELELLAGLRRGGEPGGHARPESGRDGCGPAGRHRPHQP